MEKIKQKLVSFDTELTEVGLGIYGRWYLATTTLLAYCSPLRFAFMDRVLPRGWLDVLIIGDTRCGKSEVVGSIVRGIKLGEFFKCENTSFAGLVGGLHQISSRAKWDIVWGKIPLNHGKLVVADEMSSLTIDDIGNMSALRSSGVAEITKIQSGTTHAATRMIWISNPRGDGTDTKSMAAYPHGVIAVRDLIGRPEDISRFDFAVAVASDDVSMDVINTKRVRTKYAGNWDALRSLVRWVWQLQPNDVLFEDSAIDAALETAKAQAKTYAASIPLVEPNEQRIRLARVSAAVAARCFSEQGGKLIVTKRHVEFADWFMRHCYDSPAMDYRTYSTGRKKENLAEIEGSGEVKDVLTKYTNGNMRMIKVFFDTNHAVVSDLETIFNIPRQEAREIMSVLVRNGCMCRKPNHYSKTKIGKQVLEAILREAKVL
jgi:hypothetical protein